MHKRYAWIFGEAPSGNIQVEFYEDDEWQCEAVLPYYMSHLLHLVDQAWKERNYEELWNLVHVYDSNYLEHEDCLLCFYRVKHG